MNSVYLHVAAPVAAAALMNGFLFSQRLSIAKKANPNPYIPPGPIVGGIWFILLGILGYIHFCLYQKGGYKFTTGCITIICFVLYCLAYPVITSLSPNPNIFFILNLAALWFALITSLRIIEEDASLMIYTIPLLVWTSYVNIVTV